MKKLRSGFLVVVKEFTTAQISLRNTCAGLAFWRETM